MSEKRKASDPEESRDEITQIGADLDYALVFPPAERGPEMGEYHSSMHPPVAALFQLARVLPYSELTVYELTHFQWTATLSWKADGEEHALAGTGPSSWNALADLAVRATEYHSGMLPEGRFMEVYLNGHLLSHVAEAYRAPHGNGWATIFKRIAREIAPGEPGAAPPGQGACFATQMERIYGKVEFRRKNPEPAQEVKEDLEGLGEGQKGEKAP